MLGLPWAKGGLVLKVYIETLGCAKNRVDSEIMMASLVAGNFQPTADPARAEVILVNSCGFLTEAVEESVERVLDLSKYKTEGACKLLVFAGCATERYREALLDELPELDAILGTSDYTQILALVNQALLTGERASWLAARPGYDMANLTAPRILSTLPHFAWLKIAEGCSNRCSFCNIPALRGGFSSKPIKNVVQEAQALIKQGVKELNLISQDSSSFGVDKDEDLLGLAQALSALEGDFWVRLFYCYPNRFPLGLLDVMAKDPRLVPYLDIPFQHVNDRILKAMNRQIKGAALFKLLEQARQKLPELSFRTSLIVGFPGETKAEFKEMLSFVESGAVDHLGVFVYSDEDNIKSQKLPKKIGLKEKEERRGLLMEAQQQVSFAKNQKRVGNRIKILVEGTSKETELLLEGRHQGQGPEVDGSVLINEGQAIAGTWAEVEIVEAMPYDLVARILEEE